MALPGFLVTGTDITTETRRDRQGGDPNGPPRAGAGDYFRALHAGRGPACGNLDDDGDLDIVIVHHHAPSVILWNESPRRGNWLMLKLQGRAPNRDAVGARLAAQIGPTTLIRTVGGGGSYLSTGDPRVHFGLDDATRVDRLEVRWPSGHVETRTNLKVNRIIEWAEGTAADRSVPR